MRIVVKSVYNQLMEMISEFEKEGREILYISVTKKEYIELCQEVNADPYPLNKNFSSLNSHPIKVQEGE